MKKTSKLQIFLVLSLLVWGTSGYAQEAQAEQEEPEGDASRWHLSVGPVYRKITKKTELSGHSHSTTPVGTTGSTRPGAYRDGSVLSPFSEDSQSGMTTRWNFQDDSQRVRSGGRTTAIDFHRSYSTSQKGEAFSEHSGTFTNDAVWGLQAAIAYEVIQKESWDIQLKFGGSVYLEGEGTVEMSSGGKGSLRQEYVETWRHNLTEYFPESWLGNNRGGGNPASWQWDPDRIYLSQNGTFVGNQLVNTVGGGLFSSKTRYDVRTQLFQLSLGAQCTVDLDESWHLSVTPALLANWIQIRLDRTEDIYDATFTRLQSWSDIADESHFEWGASLQAQLDYDVSAHWGIFASVGYEWLPEVTLESDFYTLTMDLSAFTASLGISCRF